MGTDVELVWAEGSVERRAEDASDPDRLIERVRVGYGLALVVYALANLAFSVPYANSNGGDGRIDTLAIIAAAATLAAVPGILHRRRRRSRAVVAGVALLAVTVLQPLLIPAELVGGHAHWAQNAIGWCVVPLLLHGPTWRGVAVLAGYWAVGAVVELICQPSATVLVNIGLGTASILSVQIFALVFNGLVREAAREAHGETEARRRLTARLRIQQAVNAEYQRRYAALVENVVPLLHELSMGDPVTADLRHRARAESRRLRALFDQATTFGHPLMQNLRDLVDAAEARGIEVTVDLAGDLPDLTEQQIEALVTPLRRAAEMAQSLLRLVVTGSGGEVSGSIVSDPGGETQGLVRGLRESPGTPEVVEAGGTLWVEVRCETGTLTHEG